MNAVEIEEAISQLAEQPFVGEEFPYAFLQAFGKPTTTIERLRSGNTNKSDVGGVLQTNNIHMAVAEPGEVTKTLAALRNSPATSKGKAKFILATDGESFEAEALTNGETVACDYADFPDHFGFFLPLAGITTVKQIRENAFDIKATARLNRLYVQLLQDNPDWAAAERRADMNHFMARLIFCFFAEDTSIFNGQDLFTATVEQMSERDASNTHEVIAATFRAMKTPIASRGEAKLPRWVDTFPYVNGGLFSGSTEVPRFSKIARSYLLHIGNLDWTKINPDIFGSMIQAVADIEERGELGMHYTSVPNILKVLNPLFLDDLRDHLEQACDNPRKLLNLRKRMTRIRVFDPACGSGNFLVIAYKEMRAIEHAVNERRGEAGVKSDIPLTNFRGIELRHFSAEVARLALIIAEYQCNVNYLGQKEALIEFLPLSADNWITCGNALRLDWLSICPPTGTGTKYLADDLFEKPLYQAEIDFENEGGETYICGNPPFTGTRKQTPQQKSDLEEVFSGYTKKWKNVDYVGAWFLRAAQFNNHAEAPFAFVATNSICQGQQVPITWGLLLEQGFNIRFAHTSFKWTNLAKNKAGVTVVVVGVDLRSAGKRSIYTNEVKREVVHINPYLTEHHVSVVQASKMPLFTEIPMEYGVYYSKSANLILDRREKEELLCAGLSPEFIRSFIGSTEYFSGKERYCLWISDDDVSRAMTVHGVRGRIDSVRNDRLATNDAAVRKLAGRPHQFRERKGDDSYKIFVPIVSSENREYFPAGVENYYVVPTNKAFFLPNAPTWTLAIIASKLHLVWIETICGRLRTDYSYSNTLGWNTFPVPQLTEKNKADLTRSAEEILLAREAHFPATIADLYDPQSMPDNLREAHERNDETLERIYMGRRFNNDTERLGKLFAMYTEMTVTTDEAANSKGGLAREQSE